MREENWKRMRFCKAEFRWKRPRQALYNLCYSKETKATQRALRNLVATGHEKQRSNKVFELLEKRVPSNLRNPAEIIKAECIQPILYPKTLN